MNKILALIVCLGVGLTASAHAESKKENKQQRKAARAQVQAQNRQVQPQVRQNQALRKQTNVANKINTQNFRPRVKQRVDLQPSVNTSVNLEGRRRGKVRVGDNNNAPNFGNDNAGNQGRNKKGNWDGNNNNPNNNNGNWGGNKNKGKNWDGNNNGNWTWNDARRWHNRNRHRRDRHWWTSNYSRFVLFGGGYYYWNNGYWYPAYGYDPYYSNYTYDEPIYGYNNLAPGEVIVQVQHALRRQGYYYGAIDGLIGPMTRNALARFQRDHGLYVTRSIDGQTLASLGLA